MIETKIKTCVDTEGGTLFLMGMDPYNEETLMRPTTRLRRLILLPMSLKLRPTFSKVFATPSLNIVLVSSSKVAKRRDTCGEANAAYATCILIC
jgi:hypothetical protein